MKRFVFSFFIFHLGLCPSFFIALAKPAKQGAILREMTDGTTQIVYLHGDEHFHYMTLENGDWVQENEEGQLVRVAALPMAEVQQRSEDSRFRKAQMHHKPYPLNITEKGLVILVNFADKKFTPLNTNEAIYEMLNGENYTYNGATGSAAQYFYDQSNGRYNPHFQVVGPVTLSAPMNYYGQNDWSGNDAHVDSLIMEACRLATKDYGVNFAEYDNDADGEVDFVYFIYAGYGEADSDMANTIWPHTFWLKDGYLKDLRLNGKYINAYACGAELSYDTKKRDGIGTFCHEFSHVLGLPDLYVTNNGTHKTMGEWDILDYGPYNNNGNTPPAYSAYERMFLGWLTPYVLDNEPLSPVLYELQESNSAVVITATGEFNGKGNDPDPSTFYILENRQKVGWDKYLPGHGLMITKVNYSYAKWYENSVNNTQTAMGVDLVEADGKAPARSTGKATDLFPAGANSYTITFATGNMYKLTNIQETAGVIHLDVNGGGEEINVQQFAPKILYIYDLAGRLQGTTDPNQLAVGHYFAVTETEKLKIIKTRDNIFYYRKRSKVKH